MEQRLNIKYIGNSLLASNNLIRCCMWNLVQTYHSKRHITFIYTTTSGGEGFAGVFTIDTHWLLILCWYWRMYGRVGGSIPLCMGGQVGQCNMYGRWVGQYYRVWEGGLFNNTFREGQYQSYTYSFIDPLAHAHMYSGIGPHLPPTHVQAWDCQFIYLSHTLQLLCWKGKTISASLPEKFDHYG